LFELARDIGKADWDKPAGAAQLVARLRAMLTHLRDHAQNEETYIHPLFDDIGSGAGQIHDEHDALEVDLEALEHLIDSGRHAELYAAYTRLLGRYLLHLDQEETAQRTVLWAHYDDNALLAVFNRFKAERAPEMARLDLEFMLPALSADELAQIYMGMKRSVSPAVFEKAVELAVQVLGESDWQPVLDRLFLTEGGVPATAVRV
jgi:hypothetical protein